MRTLTPFILADKPEYLTKLFELNLRDNAEIQCVGGCFEEQHFDPCWFQQYHHIPYEMVDKARRSRQAEFFAGRYCADMAIRALLNTADRFRIGTGSHGQPLWPDGVHGSITHCDNIAIAAVSRQVTTIGIDCERIMDCHTATQIANVVCHPDECNLLAEYNQPFHYLFTLLFSAKESLYKAIYPYIATILEFKVVKATEIDFRAKTILFHLEHNLTDNYEKGHMFKVNFEMVKGAIFTTAINIE